jgi:hypothetical protein
MQKSIILFALIPLTPVAVCAQNTPPSAVVTAFNQKFQNVEELEWEMEKNGEWEAEFEQNEVDMSANFSAGGLWLETETEIKAVNLPIPVKAALKGKKVKEAAKIVRADGSTVYEAEVKKKDMIFDAGGKLLPADKD